MSLITVFTEDPCPFGLPETLGIAHLALVDLDFCG